MRALPLAIIASVIGLITACNDIGCMDNRSSIPLAGFYSYQTGQTITLDSVEIGGVDAPNDSLLMKAGDKNSTLYLPFRFEKNNTCFFIRYVSQELNFPQFVDTLYFEYTSLPMFVSQECGAMYQYHIELMRYTTHLIDSVAITDSLITNIDTQRLKIFFRTQQPDEDIDNTEGEDA